MNASISNTIDRDKLVRLFKPGSGAMPPRLAGREPEMGRLRLLLDNLLDEDEREPPPADCVLYGPRGNGKTVLLDALKEQCKGADVISLAATEITDTSDLAALLLYEDEGFKAHLDGYKPSGRTVNLKVASQAWRKMGQSERDDHARKHLVSLLVERSSKKPLVVTLDEAHTLDKAVGGALLNASQRVRREKSPFLLVLAGTPNLRSHLENMDSTFWNRSEIIGVGRLDAAATREALVAPLDEYGIGFDDDALETIISESQQYPYFIQLWGQALCLALRDSEAARIDIEVVNAARPEFSRARLDYYEDRYAELKKKGLLAVARTVGSAFEGKHSIDDDDLEYFLKTNNTINPGRVADALERLADLGYIWKQVASTHYEPGIPSLMGYVLTERKVYSAQQAQAGARENTRA